MIKSLFLFEETGFFVYKPEKGKQRRGILGLANLRGIIRGVTGLIGTHNPTGKIVFFGIVFFGIFRLFILASILTILVALKLINIFGILIGFTVVFIVIIKEGPKIAKEL